jgi:hypothetical protein
MKALCSFEMLGTTHPVTYHIPEDQHPQYATSLHISNTALSAATKGRIRNTKIFRIAEMGSWNLHNKRQQD